jgi:hypothetical protein
MGRFIIPVTGTFLAFVMKLTSVQALQIEIDTDKGSEEILAQIELEIGFYQRRIERDKICIHTLEKLKSMYNIEKEKLNIDKLCTAGED